MSSQGPEACISSSPASSAAGILLYAREDGSDASGRTLCLSHPAVSSLRIFLRLAGTDPVSPSLGNNNTMVPTLQFFLDEACDLTSFGLLNGGEPFLGLLGSMFISGQIYVFLVSRAVQVGSLLGEPIYRITQVDAYSASSSEHDLHLASYPASFAEAADEGDDRKGGADLHRSNCVDIVRLLSDGSFYYSPLGNITRRSQERLSEDEHPPRAASVYSWTEYLNDPLHRFVSEQALPERLKHALSRAPFSFHVMRGFVTSFSFDVSPAGEDEERALADLPPLKAPFYASSSIQSLLKSGLSGAARLSSSILRSAPPAGPASSAGLQKRDPGALPPSTDPARPYSFLLVSRIGARRAGTRFLTRGIDDDGNVANFVETEMAVTRGGSALYSFVSVRGSVPVFWEQQGIQIGQPKIQFTRSFEGTELAFKSHIDSLLGQYGPNLHVLNLLSGKASAAESTLARRFQRHVQGVCRGLASSVSPARIKYTHFDMNAAVRDSYDGFSGRLLNDMIGGRDQIQHIGFLEYDLERGSVRKAQTGTFRLNCLDCLDRTNVVQSILSQEVFSRMLGEGCSLDNAALALFNAAWADNGDALALIYTGTGALKSGFTRTGRRTLAGIVDDLRKSTHRFYVNNFQDKFRQRTVDLLLGKGVFQKELELVPSPLAASLPSRQTDILEGLSESFLVYACTFNLHGISPEHINFGSLLRPIWKHSKQTRPDILAFAFQEAVELSAQEVVLPSSSDVSRIAEWEDHIFRYLSGFFPDTPYAVLSTVQLVGLVLVLVLSKKHFPHVKKVERLIRKVRTAAWLALFQTGFGGVAGNKGSVALRFSYGASRSFCFVNSHLSSGQDSVSLRNREFASVLSESKFASGAAIGDHGTVVWMGDLNYRIDLPLEACLEHLCRGAGTDSRELGHLLAQDQLFKERLRGAVLDGFSEDRITFPPTYKFLENSDEYDLTSRVPGWTDRIFFKAGGTSPVMYTWIEDMVVSDHRPVVALLQAGRPPARPMD